MFEEIYLTEAKNFGNLINLAYDPDTPTFNKPYVEHEGNKHEINKNEEKEEFRDKEEFEDKGSKEEL